MYFVQVATVAMDKTISSIELTLGLAFLLELDILCLLDSGKFMIDSRNVMSFIRIKGNLP